MATVTLKGNPNAPEAPTVRMGSAMGFHAQKSPTTLMPRALGAHTAKEVPLTGPFGVT